MKAVKRFFNKLGMLMVIAKLVAMTTREMKGNIISKIVEGQKLGERYLAVDGQRGNIIQVVLAVMIVVVVIGAAIPVVWPIFVGTDTDIQAMTETDDATVFFKAIWPIALLVLGLSIGAGVIFWSLRKMGVIGN